ncbi:gliding motility lipoprotein GldD [Aquimarina sp. AD10]|uniref:Gliding motility lipoprotein GldD n=1 Tax=Aquimarina aggregata TaxID=1642818 RepID=A0A162ZKW9_9FLAO|nr:MULTISPECIES: gliding motility lipoprotein GldD [Aquimarina]AXT62185.1 gliding motility lipoprotein GldD [Aquimarina sp. AD10]KZS39869.1 gliding motility lipoprotein GldD [Aquimarina aggregata]RKM90620.1 gliding motility lipoprotein GldD [Aquimarina sp. AD10]
MKNTIVRCSILGSILLLICSCAGEVIPKPKGMLRLSYPEPKYIEVTSPCPYTFEKNEFSELKRARRNRKCWYNLEYKKLKATMYLSYYRVDNNLDSLLRDAQNLTQEHVVKADGIIQGPFVDEKNKVFGMFYEVSGDAASQSQFYLTDSTRHFLVGSIYFEVKPNYDSILPAADYLRNDMRHLMETLRWVE